MGPRLGRGGGAVDIAGAGAAAAVGSTAAPGGARGTFWAALGAANGALCTAPTGARDGAGTAPEPAAGAAGNGAAGGASTAGIEALAVCVPGGGAGGGGGTVPLPNSSGEAVGDDGSANGANAARCCALARSAISPLDRLASAARSGSAGFGGTVARLGYGSVAPGGGGRCCAIAPPCSPCHQDTGFIDDGNDEQPDSSSASIAEPAGAR
jgi:hypothetical protein